MAQRLVWLTDWDEAARHAWKTRSLLFLGFAVITAGTAAFVGVDLRTDWPEVAAISAMIGTAAVIAAEPLLSGRRHAHRSVSAAALAAVALALSVPVAAAVHPLVGLAIVLIGVVAAGALATR